MRPVTRTTIPLITCLALACGASGDPETTTEAQTSAGPTAATTGSTTAHPTEGAETHASHAAHTEDAGTSPVTGASTANHETGGTDTGGPSPAAYCACMLENCHDQYHGTWGEDHRAAEAMCAAAAAALPSVGMPATRGNSLECRYYYCELGHADPTACESAIGGGECV